MIAVDYQWMISGWLQWLQWMNPPMAAQDIPFFTLRFCFSFWIPASWAAQGLRDTSRADLDLFIRQWPGELYKSRGSPRGSWSWYMPSWVSARHHPTSGEWFFHIETTDESVPVVVILYYSFTRYNPHGILAIPRNIVNVDYHYH